MQQAHEPGFRHVPNRQPAKRVLVELRQPEHLEVQAVRDPRKSAEHLGAAPTDSNQDKVRSFLADDVLEIGEATE
jgi:hypothetical protein